MTYKVFEIYYMHPKSVFYVFHSLLLQSRPGQFLTFLLNIGRFSGCLKYFGNACQGRRPRGDIDSIPYDAARAFANFRFLLILLLIIVSLSSIRISVMKFVFRFFLVLKVSANINCRLF